MGKLGLIPHWQNFSGLSSARARKKTRAHSTSWIVSHQINLFSFPCFENSKQQQLPRKQQHMFTNYPFSGSKKSPPFLWSLKTHFRAGLIANQCFTHTRTPILSLSRTLAHPFSLFHTHTHTPILSLSHTLTHPFSLFHAHLRTHIHTLLLSVFAFLMTVYVCYSLSLTTTYVLFLTFFYFCL